MRLATASLFFALAMTAPSFADGASADPLKGTNWQLVSLGDTPAVSNAQSTLLIADDGAVSGKGGCNGYGGDVVVKGNAVTFSQMRSTMMACEEDVMKQEHGLFMALEASKSYKVDGQTLSLLDASGAPVATFKPVS